MREIVDDQNAAFFALHLKSAAHTSKCTQRFFDGVARNVASESDGCGGEGVQNVVAACKRQSNLGHFLRAMGDAEFHAVINMANVAGDPGGGAVESVSFYRAKCFFCYPADCGGMRIVIAPSDNSSAARNQIYESAELQFDGREIGVNIGVIEFQRGDDELVGMIVKKFWAFVEECGVVLVAFNDEIAVAT